MATAGAIFVENPSFATAGSALWVIAVEKMPGPGGKQSFHVKLSNGMETVIDVPPHGFKGHSGEVVATAIYKQSGGEVYSGKLNGSNHGIDVISIKRDAGGNVSEIYLVEVKTSETLKKPADTKMGPHNSADWRDSRIEAMRAHSDPAMRSLGELLFRNKRRVVPKTLHLDDNGNIIQYDVDDTTGRPQSPHAPGHSCD